MQYTIKADYGLGHNLTAFQSLRFRFIHLAAKNIDLVVHGVVHDKLAIVRIDIRISGKVLLIRILLRSCLFASMRSSDSQVEKSKYTLTYFFPLFLSAMNIRTAHLAYCLVQHTSNL
jgi:hypothetical protein